MQAIIPCFAFYSLHVSAILDHFGYPPPHLDQWQQRIWYDLQAAQESLHQMCNRLSRGLPAVASPPRAEPPLSSFKPASMPLRLVTGENSLRLQEVGAQP